MSASKNSVLQVYMLSSMRMPRSSLSLSPPTSPWQSAVGSSLAFRLVVIGIMSAAFMLTSMSADGAAPVLLLAAAFWTLLATAFAACSLSTLGTANCTEASADANAG